MRQCVLAIILVMGFGGILHAQASAPAATAPQLSEGPLKLTVSGVDGTVQVRQTSDQPWQLAKVGMVLDEGAEFRTSIRSAVRFTIPPDQTIALDQLGTVQVLRSTIQNGKVVTDLGMKYGRTRYEIEAAGKEHDAVVRSPNAVLGVRGTKFALYDQPPFSTQATSLIGTVSFRDVKKQVSFGGQAKAQISPESSSSADQALQQTVLDPHGKFGGRSESDALLQAFLIAYGGNDFSNLGVLSVLHPAGGTFTGTGIVALTIQQQLRFFIDWPGSSLADVDLSVISPLKETVSATNPQVPSGGLHFGNVVATGEPFNVSETVVWPLTVPLGKYTLKVDLKSGGPVTVNATADDPLSESANNRIDFKTTTLDRTTPSITIPVKVQKAPTAGTATTIKPK